MRNVLLGLNCVAFLMSIFMMIVNAVSDDISMSITMMMCVVVNIICIHLLCES